MEIIEHPHAVEIKDGTGFEITFWDDGEIIISGIGCDDVVFGELPTKLMSKIQQLIINYKKENV